ncbi:MFS transporter [Sphingobium sp. TCM1]|uniref:MFS transporter n=1 Tax=Sphingobium sp. TCM1 TaxID=453246 RepID=UPI00082C9616|nr:MFS transporter [Sphingobium sp. TCM1]
MNSSYPVRESSLSFPGWRVLLAAVVGLAFSPGPMIFGSLGLFAPHLADSFGWGRGAIMLSLTFFNIAGVLASSFTGQLIDRLGVRTVLFPSLIMLATGFLGLSLTGGSLFAFYGLTFLWGALTVGTQSISYTKLITGWFIQRRGLAVGIAAAGLGLGYTVIPLLVAQLLAVMDWRPALCAMAALLIVPFLLNLLLSHPNMNAVAKQGDGDGLSLSEARRTGSFWLMASAILLASMALTGVVPHIALLALDRGLPTAQAAIVASTYGLSTIFGRVLVGALADHFFVPRVAICFFAMSAAGFILAAFVGDTHSVGLLALVALTIGLGFGAESDVIALFISRYFGQRCFGAIYGDLLAIFLIGASAGPALFGFGRDLTGGYQAPMIAGSAAMAMACLLLSRLAPYPVRFVPTMHRSKKALA